MLGNPEGLPDLWDGRAAGQVARCEGPASPNRVERESEEAILAHSLKHPTQGPLRVAQELVLDEHFRIQGRTKWSESLEEMQKDLDSYLATYNHKRPHQGRNMNGRTPYKAFVAWRPKPDKAAAKQVKKAA